MFLSFFVGALSHPFLFLVSLVCFIYIALLEGGVDDYRYMYLCLNPFFCLLLIYQSILTLWVYMNYVEEYTTT
jgi:hypothetical protein